MKEQGRVTEAKEKLIKTKNLLGGIFKDPLSSFDILSPSFLVPTKGSSGLEPEKADEVTSLIASTLESLEKEAVKEVSKKEGDDNNEEEVEEEEEERVELMRVEAPNPLLPALSSALEVAYRPEVGRHLVATQEIGEFVN